MEAMAFPGEAYKALRKYITKPIRILMNKIQSGHPIPQCWKEGTLVHIYKNKGIYKTARHIAPYAWPE